jgi:hypothetical protein
MKACGGCPAGQRGSAPRRALARALAWSPLVEGTSGPETSAALMCHRPERAQAAGNGLLWQPLAGRPRRGVRGLPSTERLLGRQGSSALTPPGAQARQGGSPWTRSRQRAVKRAAVGGRMTARWSGVFSGDAETRDRRGSGRRTSAGFPTALGRQSPKMMFRRVLVTRNVGCRSGIRGTLVPPPRKAARPHEGPATSSDGRGD